MPSTSLALAVVYVEGAGRALSPTLAHTRFMAVLARRLCLAAAVAACATSAAAQDTVTNPSVVLVQMRASELLYPAIARSARISGKIDVRVGVRPDGSVAEVTTFPLERFWQFLQGVATVAAAHASFECRGCTEPLTTHAITFVFALGGRSDSAGNPPPPVWKQTGIASSEVTIVALEVVIDHGGPTTRVLHDRAARCLWLWRCSR